MTRLSTIFLFPLYYIRMCQCECIPCLFVKKEISWRLGDASASGGKTVSWQDTNLYVPHWPFTSISNLLEYSKVILKTSYFLNYIMTEALLSSLTFFHHSFYLTEHNMEQLLILPIFPCWLMFQSWFTCARCSIPIGTTRKTNLANYWATYYENN